MRLQTKEVDPLTRRVRRRWDRPRTPFERLVSSGCLSSDTISRLTELYERTDPLTLRQQIERDILALFALPGAQPDQSEDVFATLDRPFTTSRKEEAIRLGDVIK